MSDKIKLLHKATTALWLELPESVARDFTDIQQVAIEELQARVEALSGAVSYIYRRQSRPSCPICADSKEIARKALAATEQENK